MEYGEIYIAIGSIEMCVVNKSFAHESFGEKRKIESTETSKHCKRRAIKLKRSLRKLPVEL